MTRLIFRPFSTNVLNSRDNFISTFDKMFDEISRNTFPEIYQNLGVEPFGKSAYPKVNVIDHDGTVTIEAELAGYNKDDIDISVQDGVLTISGASQSTEHTDKSVYLLRELKRSAFSRSFKLGDQLDVSDIAAQFNNGLLVVTLQKLTKEPETKKVTIK
jgi:HSP20 family protein